MWRWWEKPISHIWDNEEGILIKTKPHRRYLMEQTPRCTVVFLKRSITLTTPVCITAWVKNSSSKYHSVSSICCLVRAIYQLQLHLRTHTHTHTIESTGLTWAQTHIKVQKAFRDKNGLSKNQTPWVLSNSPDSASETSKLLPDMITIDFHANRSPFSSVSLFLCISEACWNSPVNETHCQARKTSKEQISNRV